MIYVNIILIIVSNVDSVSNSKNRAGTGNHFPQNPNPHAPPHIHVSSTSLQKTKKSLICSFLVVMGVKVAKSIKIVSRLFSVRLWHIIVCTGY